MTVLSCTYPNSSKRFEYAYYGDKPVEAGDLAVVSSPYSGYVLVTVRSVYPYGHFPGNLKSVLEVISLAAERKAKEVAKRKAEIERKLDAKLRKYSKELLYARLADVDSEAFELLEELKSL